MWLRGLGVAMASCIVGALIPLYRASRVPPINAFQGAARQRSSRSAANGVLIVGAMLLAISYGVFLLPGNSPVAGFVMASLVGLGFALTCPWITRAGSRLLELASRPLQMLPLQMAAAGVSRSLGITGVAVAAMMLAMSMNVGIRTMVSSFRESLGHWMDQRFAADVFVAPELTVRHKIDATLDPAIEPWVLRQPNVQSVIEYRIRNTELNDKPISLLGTKVSELLMTLPIKKELTGQGDFNPQADALISEPLAGRIKLGVGDALNLNTPTGPHRFRVYAIYYDFGSERGQVMLDRQTYAKQWNDDTLSSLHVRLTPGVNRRQTAERWTALLREKYPVVVNNFDGVKAEALVVFDRTFAVTDVLTWLAGGIAFCGLAGSLLALALARRRDYSILAAVGMSMPQTAAWVLAQGMLIAWAATLVGCIAGTALAYVLAYVIQYRSFGWSIPTSPHPRFWVENLVLATAAAIIAAIYPVIRLRNAAPARSLRYE
jgi:putative ABC transport system permease protein